VPIASEHGVGPVDAVLLDAEGTEFAGADQFSFRAQNEVAAVGLDRGRRPRERRNSTRGQSPGDGSSVRVAGSHAIRPENFHFNGAPAEESRVSGHGVLEPGHRSTTFSCHGTLTTHCILLGPG
jgi:hypothetical protein